MGQKQGLEMVVETARLLVGQPRYLFVMCGDGVARNRLQTLADGL
jgi:colanic acid biosynthesis glycosyl transferase WcaI